MSTNKSHLNRKLETRKCYVGGNSEHSDVHCAHNTAASNARCRTTFIKIIIIIFINCNWVVTRWQWLFYMYTKHEIGYY